MSKFTKAIAAIMLMVAVVFSTGCKKDPDNGGNNNGGGNGGGNGGNSNPIPEGIYLGIIGFNQHLYEKEISLLKASTKESFISHINGLETRDGTGLYWADNTALMRLKSFGEPIRLTTVALVTFTDGLDNVSLDDNVTNPDNYPTKEAYLEGLSGKIRQDKVYNKDITAYTIGLRGNDVNDVDEFHANIKKLASEDGNGIEVSDMNHALQKFTEIAESLHSVTFTASLTLLIPPGYDDGQIVRFTFDDIPSTSTAAENSTSYIECTYKRTEDGRRLENITYHGWQPGSSSVSSFEKVDRYYKVAFENLTKTNGNLISNDDKRYLQLFYKTPSGIWQKDSEFKPDTFSNVIEEQSSALILLVLDCTTSLGSEFSSLKNAAKQFVETLVRSNSGGSNGGGGNGGGSSQYYDISVSANPNNGGTVSGGGSYQQGQTCTLSAIPASGYTFVKWTENGTIVSTDVSYSFNVNRNRTLLANFELTYVPSQSLQFEWNSHVYYDGEIIECTNDEYGIGEFVQHMQIRNLTSESMRIIIEKQVIQDLEGAIDYFCWGTCFSPEVIVSPYGCEVFANSLNDDELSFHVLYQEGIYGVVIIKYYAYDENNPSERISIVVRYNRR